jgi:MFS family permease
MTTNQKKTPTREVHEGIGTELFDTTTPPPAPVKIGGRFIAAIAIANFGIWVGIMAPLLVGLQLKIPGLITDPTSQPVVLAGVLATGSVAGIIAMPLAGRLSDRTTARIGMRRPWLVGGVLIVLIGALVVGFGTGLGAVFAGWVLTMIGANTVISVLTALIPDHVPIDKRGLVSGVMGAGQAVAALVAAGIAAAVSTNLPLVFVVPAVVAAITVLVVVVAVPDRKLSKADRPTLTFRAFIASFWLSPRKAPDFAWAWVSRFLIFLSFGTVVNFQLFYLSSQLGLTPQEATALLPLGIGIQTVALVITSLVFGPISDRVGRRKIFVMLSGFVGVIGFVVLAFTVSQPGYFAAMALIGVAQAIYFSVDLALVTDVLPDKVHDAGKDLGVFNLANIIPQVVGPAIAPLFLAIPLLASAGGHNQNYTALFIACGVFAIGSALSVLKVRGAK